MFWYYAIDATYISFIRCHINIFFSMPSLFSAARLSIIISRCHCFLLRLFHYHIISMLLRCHFRCHYFRFHFSRAFIDTFADVFFAASLLFSAFAIDYAMPRHYAAAAAIWCWYFISLRHAIFADYWFSPLIFLMPLTPSPFSRWLFLRWCFSLMLSLIFRFLRLVSLITLRWYYYVFIIHYAPLMILFHYYLRHCHFSRCAHVISLFFFDISLTTLRDIFSSFIYFTPCFIHWLLRHWWCHFISLLRHFLSPLLLIIFAINIISDYFRHFHDISFSLFISTHYFSLHDATSSAFSCRHFCISSCWCFLRRRCFSFAYWHAIIVIDDIIFYWYATISLEPLFISFHFHFADCLLFFTCAIISFIFIIFDCFLPLPLFRCHFSDARLLRLRHFSFCRLITLLSFSSMSAHFLFIICCRRFSSFHFIFASRWLPCCHYSPRYVYFSLLPLSFTLRHYFHITPLMPRRFRHWLFHAFDCWYFFFSSHYLFSLFRRCRLLSFFRCRLSFSDAFISAITLMPLIAAEIIFCHFRHFDAIIAATFIIFSVSSLYDDADAPPLMLFCYAIMLILSFSFWWCCWYAAAADYITRCWCWLFRWRCHYAMICFDAAAFISLRADYAIFIAALHAHAMPLYFHYADAALAFRCCWCHAAMPLIRHLLLDAFVYFRRVPSSPLFRWCHFLHAIIDVFDADVSLLLIFFRFACWCHWCFATPHAAFRWCWWLFFHFAIIDAIDAMRRFSPLLMFTRRWYCHCRLMIIFRWCCRHCSCRYKMLFAFFAAMPLITFHAFRFFFFIDAADITLRFISIRHDAADADDIFADYAVITPMHADFRWLLFIIDAYFFIIDYFRRRYAAATADAAIFADAITRWYCWCFHYAMPITLRAADAVTIISLMPRLLFWCFFRDVYWRGGFSLFRCQHADTLMPQRSASITPMLSADCCFYSAMLPLRVRFAPLFFLFRLLLILMLRDAYLRYFARHAMIATDAAFIFIDGDASWCCYLHDACRSFTPLYRCRQLLTLRPCRRHYCHWCYR